MGNYCVTDPDKLNKICANKETIDVSFTKKAKNEIKEIKKEFKNEMGGEMNFEDNKNLDTIINAALGPSMTTRNDEIKASTCVPTQGGHDQLVLLKSNEFVNDQDQIIVPIPIRKGKCDKLINRTFLKEKKVTKDVFEESMKIEMLKLHDENDD